MKSVFIILVSAAVVVAQPVHYTLTVIVDSPNNLVCPSHTQVDFIRAEISQNISEILFEIAANKMVSYNIPECGGGGWKRVTLLNMTDPSQTCPDQWKMYEPATTGIRACGRLENRTSSCNSVQFITRGYSYTEVCGRVTGYQYASPDGLYHSSYLRSINSPYVDGVSVTHGTPRQHIWTLYAGVREFALGCCSTSSPPDFVGSNYFCDTGNPQNEVWRNRVFTDEPLWDGVAGCRSNPLSCCAPHAGPWFHSQLVTAGDEPVVDDIEVRICGGESTSNEDTPLELVEIYVRR